MPLISDTRKPSDPYINICNDVLTSSKSQLLQIADTTVKLVPIRIDLEYDGVRLKDTFTWNLNGM
jgi:hypothetical protein